MKRGPAVLPFEQLRQITLDEAAGIVEGRRRIEQPAEGRADLDIENEGQTLQPANEEVRFGARALADPGEPHFGDHLPRQGPVHDDRKVAIAERLQRLERQIAP